MFYILCSLVVIMARGLISLGCKMWGLTEACVMQFLWGALPPPPNNFWAKCCSCIHCFCYRTYNTKSLQTKVQKLHFCCDMSIIRYVIYCSLFTETAAVTEFAKKTGDLRSLSTTDIRLIALVYTLEKEHVGTDHLRTEPTKKVLVSELLSTSTLNIFRHN